ncbi:hypothetical protein HYU19_04085 [Candidatus Woesearchaeota archaeon]|nr:hypothetical protein [Candidatus Woesearchaeota archaeon]
MHDQLELLRKIEGLQTVETAAKALGMKQQSALNLLSRLKKQGYVTVSGGGRIKRIYKITLRKQLPRDPGMFDIINKYSPNMKLNPWYDHQVHGTYGPEEALVDALQTDSFRTILASIHLFNHITNWPKLYGLAKQKNCWQKAGALYDVARMFIKVRKMPKKYRKGVWQKRIFFIKDYVTKEKQFFPVSKAWNVQIPFRLGDMEKTIQG